MRCPKCGTNNPPEEQLTYCKKCGTELRTICPRCSADNPGNAEHCNECGLDLHPDLGHERMAGIRKDKDTVIVAGVLKKKPTISAGMLAFAIGALVVVWIPIIMAMKKRSQLNGCQSNLKKLALAMQAYARDNGGHAPTASDWTASLLPYVRDRNVFICPTRPGKVGYSFNLNMNEVPLTELTNAGTLIAFFESDVEENVSGSQTLWLASPVHSRGNNLAFADGTVRQALTTPPDQYWSVKMKSSPSPPPEAAVPSTSTVPGNSPNSSATDSPAGVPTGVPTTLPVAPDGSVTPPNPPAP